MVTFVSVGLIVLSVLTQLSLAQTYTDCNPLNATCPEDVGLSNYTFSTDFTKGENTSWVAADYTTITYSDLGAAFTINSASDAPTIHTDFYIFFGYVEVKLRAANGTGIVSSIVLESDDLDEVDWEWLGGNNTSVETNYFGKGNTTAYDRAIYYSVSTPTEKFHTYALNWTSSSITWLIDGAVVRTLEYASALDGKNYPQTPCRVNLGVWAGGASSSEGTVAWAGGATDFADAPFTMYVESVKIINYNPAVNYNWTDQTGTYESIEIVNKTVGSNSSTATGGASAGFVSATAVAASASSSSASTKSVSSSTTTSSSSSSSSAVSTSFSQGSSAASRVLDIAWASSGIAALLVFSASHALL